jgi:hypothetical protein
MYDVPESAPANDYFEDDIPYETEDSKTVKEDAELDIF